MTTTHAPRLIDTREAQHALELLLDPGQVVEIRALKANTDGSSYKATFGGYFNDIPTLVRSLSPLRMAQGIYFTLQECDPDLLSVAENKIKRHTESGSSTADKHIRRYRWLLLDSDSERAVKHISSSDAEHEQALAHSAATRQVLREQGWPEPIRADSGNGSHLLYRIDLPASESELVKRVLAGIAARVDTEAIKIDTSVFNPARICKLYGSMACKGDNTSTRPHRRAQLLEVPTTIEVVTREQLERMAVALPTPPASAVRPGSPASASKRLTSIADFLHKHHIRYTQNQGIYILTDGCVFDPSHRGRDAAVFEKDGRWCYKCFHQSCAGKGWRDFRQHFEPGDQHPMARSGPDHERASRASNGPGKDAVTGAANGAARQSKDVLPEIIIGGQLREVSQQALAALQLGEQDHPTIFVKEGRLVHLTRDEKKTPIIRSMGVAEVRHALTRTGDYYRIKAVSNSDSVKLISVSPPRELAEDILALDPGTWPFPALAGMVEMPIMRPDGSILDTPGYDAVTRLYYVANEQMQSCKIPQQPTPEQVAQAVQCINTCIGEFPYEGTADYANMFALLLTLVTRYMHSGDVQTALINATKQGTGKTLLAQVAGIIATGKHPALTGFPTREEETKKVIDAKVLAGVSLIVFDNIKRTFASSALDQLTTSGGWYSVRPLGQSKDIPVQIHCTVIATGNNVQLDSDMARRCYQIRLVSPTSTPDEREDITIKALIEYTSEHRVDLVAALLTLARAWFVAGRPRATNKLARAASSFTRWANTVGGILEHAGIQGFQDNRDELKAAASEELQIIDFLHAWHERYGSAWVLAREIATVLKHAASADASVAGIEPLLEMLPDDLSEAFFEKDKSIKSMTLGLSKWLQRQVKTPYGQDNIHIEQRKDEHTHTQQWRVLRVLASVDCGQMQEKYVSDTTYRDERQKNEMSEKNTRQHSQHSQDTITDRSQSGLQSGSNDKLMRDEGEGREKRTLAENEGSEETLSILFIKKYKGREELLPWSLPGSGIADGLVSARQWYEHFKQAYKSPDPLVRREALEQLRQKVKT